MVRDKTITNRAKSKKGDKTGALVTDRRNVERISSKSKRKEH